MRIAVIPARGGSKRIPRKNVKDFAGKPMVVWSIEAAISSGLFDRVIVSTDDAEIASIARSAGADVPFVRPRELCDDFAGTTEVVAHAVRWASGAGLDCESVCCIYATAPFVQAADLRRGLAALESGDWLFSFSVTDYGSPVFRAFTQAPGGGVTMLFPEAFDSRSQDLPEVWHDAGQFYWGTPEAWLTDARIFADHSFPVRIPRWRVQDIDTPDDWHRAELMYRAMIDMRAVPPEPGDH